MLLKSTGAAVMAAAAAATASPASAQACGHRDQLVEQLDSQHAEHLVAAGLHDEQHLVELWASADGATWTLLLSRADGFACIMGAGNAWYAYPEADFPAGVKG